MRTSEPCLDSRLKATAVWLVLATGVVVVAAVNRLWDIPLLRTPLVDALRLCDLLVLFVFAPLAVGLHWQLLNTMIGGGHGKAASRVLFVLGVYLFGVGFGMHEPMNALPLTAAVPVALRTSIRFFDNALGHWVFFAGFMLMVLAVVWAEVANPLPVRLAGPVAGGVLALGLIIGGVIFVNMFREQTTVDLIALTVTLVLTLALWRPSRTRSWRQRPITTITALACLLGTLPTLLYWALRAIAAC